MAEPNSKTDVAIAPPYTIEVKVRLQALVIPEAVGGYSILVPGLPGCVSQAETEEEIEANVIEAAELWLDVGHDRNKEEDLRTALGESKTIASRTAPAPGISGARRG